MASPRDERCKARLGLGEGVQETCRVSKHCGNFVNATDFSTPQPITSSCDCLDVRPAVGHARLRCGEPACPLEKLSQN